MGDAIDLKVTKKDQKIIEELYSSDEEVVIKALDKIMEDGNKSIMPALIHVLSTTDKDIIKEGIQTIVCQLKDTASIELMILFLQVEKYSSIHNQLLTALWQTGYDCSKYLSLFVDIALNGDYLVCIDVLSIIENMKSTFEDEEIQNLVEKIEFSTQDTESKKSQLLSELTDTVRSL
ncbi:MAG: hypothetical protein HRT72_05305 [Flavobacteriales bacterium]|nr:hypothetical protein [Flavobacteriales bacterium]